MNSSKDLPSAWAGLSGVASHYDVILCDVWGVVHDGKVGLKPAADALIRYRKAGGTVILITNAPRPRGPILRMLDGMGVPRGAYDALISSGDVTVDIIVERGDDPLYHLGPARDRPLFEEAAQRSGRYPTIVPLAEADCVICTGLYDDRDDLDTYYPALQAMKARDLPLVCANPDIVVHVGDDLIFCAGAIAQRYAEIGGPVLLIGKPHPPIYEAVRAEARRIRGADTSPARTLAIGDGMFTDMLGARREGYASLFITSGIHRDSLGLSADSAEIDAQAFAKLAAEAGGRPTGHMAHLVW